MAAMNNAQTVALQLEKVRDKLPLLYERDDVFFGMIQKRGDVEATSSRNMRIPLQVLPGGKASGYNPDGGDMGRGGGTTYDVAQVSPIFQELVCELTDQVGYATNTAEKAIENAAKLEIKNGMKQFRTYLDALCQTAGNGIIGTISSVSSAALTMSVPFGAALAIDNNDYNILSSNLATNRGTVTVASHDPVTTQVINLTANAPGGTVAGDVIVEKNVTPTNTVSLFGIPYHQNNAVTGTWLNLNRATYPFLLQTPSVNANSSSLTPQMVRLAISKQRKSLGVDSWQKSKPIAYMNLDQSAAWENVTIGISQVILNQLKGGQPDALPGLPKNMGGVEIRENIHADQTRIDFLSLAHWGRAVMQDIDFKKTGTQTVFPVYGASGGVSSSYVFYFITGFQLFVDSPRSGAYIYGLARPSGF